jgi:hypothetical protein
MNSHLIEDLSSFAPNYNSNDNCQNDHAGNDSTDNASKRSDGCGSGRGRVIGEVVGGIGEIVIITIVTVEKSCGTVAPDITAA